MTDLQAGLPADYGQLLTQLKTTVRQAQLRATRVVNTELITLYWTLGKAILDRQEAEGWGTKVINRLAQDLAAEFPSMTGLSRRNIHYMRAFAAAWPSPEVVQQAAAQLPWAHIMILLDKLKDQEARDWYAAQALERGWSRAMLLNQIMADTRGRSGGVLSNFAAQLPAGSDLARQLLKDPYVFDFLDLTQPAAERELENALMAHLEQFLLELGQGFAFVGRQFRFVVDGDEFAIDLLFFNWMHNRFVVLELKVGKFSPAHAGQLGMYVAWVQDKLAQPHHEPTVGVLVCAHRNAAVVKYALAAGAPMAVSRYTYDYDALPTEVRTALPRESDLAQIVEHPVVNGRQMTLAEAFAEFDTPFPDAEPD